MLKATKCIINFQGWQDLRKLKGISYDRKDKNEGTDMKGTDKRVEVVEEQRSQTRHVTNEQLKEYKVLPKVESAV